MSNRVTDSIISSTRVTALAALAAANARSNANAIIPADKRPPGLTDDINSGNYPGSVWRANGRSWQCMQNGAGNAVWQLHQDVPLPGDVIGLNVSACTVASGGTGWVTGNTAVGPGGVVFTATASSGVVTAWSLTQTRMRGVVSPPANPVTLIALTGTGTGATVNLTIQSPVIYSARRATKRYSGALMQVQNSVSQQTLDVPFLSDGSLDEAAISSFAAGVLPMSEYIAWNSGPVPGVAKWYDQGGGGFDATQPTIKQQPVIYAQKRHGNTPALTFHAQGADGGDANVPPGTTKLIIPVGVAMGGSDATAITFSGSTGLLAGIACLDQTAAGAQRFGIADGSQGLIANSNAAGNGSANTPAFATLPETPCFIASAWAAGVGFTDSTFTPPPAALFFYQSGTVVVGSTASVTGVGYSLPASRTVTYTATAADAANANPNYAMIAGLVLAINADPVFAVSGITAQVSPINGGWIAVYVPLGLTASTFSLSAAGGNGITMNTRSFVQNGAGGSFAGGAIGRGLYTTTSTGFCQVSFVAFVPWGMTARETAALKLSLHHHFDAVPQAGAVLHIASASNSMGSLTPFLQSWPAQLRRELGRDDIVVFNKAAGGQAISSIDATFYANTHLPAMLQVKSQSNNWLLIYGTYNDLPFSDGAARLYASFASLAAKAHAAGWKVAVAAEGPKNTGGTLYGGLTLNQQMLAFRNLLNASVGVFDLIVDEYLIPIFNRPTGPWAPPIYDTATSGTHKAAAGVDATAVMWANALATVLV